MTFLIVQSFAVKALSIRRLRRVLSYSPTYCSIPHVAFHMLLARLALRVNLFSSFGCLAGDLARLPKLAPVQVAFVS